MFVKSLQMVPSRLEIVLIDFEGECDFKYLNLVISLSDPCVEQFLWKLRHLYLGQLNLVCHVELVFSSAPSLKSLKIENQFSILLEY